jgi:hypothetical protein
MSPVLPPCSPALISIWVVVAELLQRVAAGGLQEHPRTTAAARTANSSKSAQGHQPTTLLTEELNLACHLTVSSLKANGFKACCC